MIKYPSKEDYNSKDVEVAEAAIDEIFGGGKTRTRRFNGMLHDPLRSLELGPPDSDEDAAWLRAQNAAPAPAP